ncbi:hypothetical protein V1523DRAFT_414259 [Lipomyces doorenjongii]
MTGAGYTSLMMCRAWSIASSASPCQSANWILLTSWKNNARPKARLSAKRYHSLNIYILQFAQLKRAKYIYINEQTIYIYVQQDSQIQNHPTNLSNTK